MATVRSKIIRGSNAAISPIEHKLAEAFLDIAAHSSELRADLSVFRFYSAVEIDSVSGRKAIVVKIPVSSLKLYRKIGVKIVQELEKKFSDKHVVIVGYRKILPKPRRDAPLSKQNRPYSRTLTSVHEKLLEDIISPFDIVGKRIRVRRDGSRLIKVLLDPKDRNSLETKVDTYSSVYHKLTGKMVAFEFPTNILS